MQWRLLAIGAACSCSLLTNVDDLRAPDAGADADAGTTLPKFVQQNANDFGGVANASLSFSAPVQAHDTIVVCVRFDSGVSSFGTLAVTDTLGDSFHPDIGPIDTGARHYVFSANDVAAGSPEIKVAVTGPSPVGLMTIYLVEYSGVSAFSTGMGMTGSSADVSSGAQQVTTPPSLVVGFVADDSVAVTPGVDFHVRSTLKGVAVEDAIALTAGTYAATATTDAGTPWAALMAIYTP